MITAIFIALLVIAALMVLVIYRQANTPPFDLRPILMGVSFLGVIALLCIFSPVILAQISERIGTLPSSGEQATGTPTSRE